MTKFGIDVSADARGILQPKLKYKYRVEFRMDGEGVREYTRNVVTADRPKVTYEEVQILSLIHI